MVGREVESGGGEGDSGKRGRRGEMLRRGDAKERERKGSML